MIKKIFAKNDLVVNSTLEEVREFLITKRDSYSRSAFRWKFFTRGLLIFSVLSASLAAVIPGLDSYHIKFVQDMPVLGIVSASLSAISTTILGVLKCEENFFFNRKQRHSMDQLIVDLSKPDANLSKVLDDLKLIMEERGSRE